MSDRPLLRLLSPLLRQRQSRHLLVRLYRPLVLRLFRVLYPALLQPVNYKVNLWQENMNGLQLAMGFGW